MTVVSSQRRYLLTFIIDKGGKADRSVRVGTTHSLRTPCCSRGRWALTQPPPSPASWCPLWAAAHRAPLSAGFSRRGCWSGSSCPPSGHRPNLAIELESPGLLHWQVGSVPLCTWEAAYVRVCISVCVCVCIRVCISVCVYTYTYKLITLLYTWN